MVFGKNFPPNTNTNNIRFEKLSEYEYEYYSGWKNHPNTNTNIIRFEKITRIRIRILFGLKKSTEYEYEYYSVWKYWPNTNTNIIRFEKIDRIRIRILFGLKISTEYEYEYHSLTSALKYAPNIPTCGWCASADVSAWPILVWIAWGKPPLKKRQNLGK